MALTYSFSAGATLNATEMNTNFADVLAELSSLTSADLSSTAGLVSTQLSDRYSYPTFTVHLAPYYGPQINTDAALAATYHPVRTFMPNTTTGTEVWRHYVQKRTGKGLYLCSVVVYCQDVNVPTAGAYPAIWVKKGTTTLGGGAAQVQADATAYYLRNSNPFDNPICSLDHDEYISLSVGVVAAAANTHVSGLSVTFTFKSELGA